MPAIWTIILLADQVDLCDKQVAYYQMDGYRGSVKCPYRVPHDLGNPGKHFDEISKVVFILMH